MLGGRNPVIIFQFKKLAGTAVGDLVLKIPLVSRIPTFIDEPPIPLYLSDRLTGIYVDTQNKNVDINTDTTTLGSGEEPEITQSGIGSTLSISLIAKRGSIGATLLSAMIDQIFDKVSSQEYAISYLNGATTIFRGLVSGYSVQENSDNDLIQIQLDITRGKKQASVTVNTPTVGRFSGPNPPAVLRLSP